MRPRRHPLLYPIALLTLLCSTSALAERLYQVEAIVFRQSGELISAGQLPPDNWAQNALPVDSSNSRSTALNSEAAKLSPGNGYQVLLHQAWTQSVGDAAPSRVAINGGSESFGHYPVQGTISLKQGRYIELDSDIWVNQFEAGVLSDSERIKQSIRLKNNELTFLDNGSLGLLIRISAQ